MATCFVIQPFDGGPFDERYDDTLDPAIRGAGLEPYRVDRDPGAMVPIADIESGIRNAAVCLADITIDNPNVWFELGFAIAARRPVVLISQKSRQHYPFDIQHRSVIEYRTDSPRAFAALGRSVTQRLKAAQSRSLQLSDIADSSPVARSDGLQIHEIAALTSIAQSMDSPTDHASVYLVRQDMERAGFTAVATTLAINVLQESGLVETFDAEDERDTYVAVRATKVGISWLQGNLDKLVLRRTTIDKAHKTVDQEADYDDLPF